MLKQIIKTCSLRVAVKYRQYSSVPSTNVDDKLDKLTPTTHNEVIDTRIIPSDDSVHFKDSESSVLDKCQEDISHVAPYLRPSFNFAAYVNKSNTLQQLVKLGVHLYKWEKKADVPPFILQLDFDKDIKNYIIFLIDLGLQTEDLANLIEKNPFILREDLDNLQVRINYLKYKKFSDEMILRILQDNPMWLSFSTQDIDKRLGFFQKSFSLSGNEVRTLAAKKPRLITYDLKHIKVNMFAFKEEMGFTPEEMKQIVLQKPKLLMNNQLKILKTFEYIHKDMNIPLETIAKMPQVLSCREFRIKQRHQFLEKLGKVQFDPKKPNYISLIALVSGSDADFATEVAGSSVHAFNAFLKTM